MKATERSAEEQRNRSMEGYCYSEPLSLSLMLP